MKHVMVAVFDKAAGAFSPPQFCPAAGVACRQFEDVVNGEESIFTRHPEHFELYQLGVFDDSNGSVDCSTAPFILVNGASARRP